MIKDNSSFAPKLLGYLGLVPFITTTSLLFLDKGHPALWSHLLISYAAVILSFVGALHWAFAMTINKSSQFERQLGFIWSVIPSLVAFISLFINEFFALILISIFFMLNLLKDKKLQKSIDLPCWYLPLRSNLTLVVISCLAISAFHSKILISF